MVRLQHVISQHVLPEHVLPEQQNKNNFCCVNSYLICVWDNLVKFKLNLENGVPENAFIEMPYRA